MGEYKLSRSELIRLIKKAAGVRSGKVEYGYFTKNQLQELYHYILKIKG